VKSYLRAAMARLGAETRYEAVIGTQAWPVALTLDDMTDGNTSVSPVDALPR
jgi:hypothetical protein